MTLFGPNSFSILGKICFGLWSCSTKEANNSGSRPWMNYDDRLQFTVEKPEMCL